MEAPDNLAELMVKAMRCENAEFYAESIHADYMALRQMRDRLHQALERRMSLAQDLPHEQEIVELLKEIRDDKR